jgi:protoporphyrinogen oxidase
VDGFVFDRTGHLLHLRHPRVKRLVGRLLAGNLVSQERNSWIYSRGVYTRYPFQSHFHGLPPEVVADCLLGVIEAQRKPRAKAPKNFAEWVLDTFGDGVARHFMFPYNRKLWTVPPGRLTTEWLGRFVPRPDLRQVILGALADAPDDIGYNASFLYPQRGGIESLVRALARNLKKVICGVAVKGIQLRPRRLVLSNGDRVGFGRLVSCVPLPLLVRMIRGVPERVRVAAGKLRWASVYNLNLGIRDRGVDRHWVYVPEDRFALYRFGYASNFSPNMAPKGAANIYTEVAYRPGGGLDRKRVVNRVIRDLMTIGVIRSRKDILTQKALDLPFAYAIYDRNRTPSAKAILSYLESKDIHSIGRYGRWEYSAMEDAILQGIELADRLRN